MSTIRTKAIILSRTNYGEADRIMNILTPDNGKLSVIAKGVRREKSKLAGGIELLAISDLTVHQGKGNLGIVTSARLDTFFAHILENYEKLQFVYYVLKDISKSAEALSEPEFYEILRIVLESLNNKQIDSRIVEAWYRLQMAILLGVGINLSTDDNGMKLIEDTTYRFDVESMSFAYDARGQYATDHIKLLRVMSAQPPAIVSQVSGVGGLIEQCCHIGKIAHE